VTLALFGCAGPSLRPAPTVPAALAVPPDQTRLAAFHAVGVQVYDCKAKPDDPTGAAWALRAPEAQLLDSKGAIVGRHYAGPTWEYRDGSRVVGAVSARADAPDGRSIPWLLLHAATTSDQGYFAPVKTVQRLNTAGGLAPGDGCDSTLLGREARVPYEADYAFYVAKH
jgi:hypothetical protein